MTLSDFSVLLLAWDDADPSVAVLGRTALPPTLPLVYRLAAQQPVLAVYPHLPTDAPDTTEPDGATSSLPAEPEPSALSSPAGSATAAPDALTIEASAPGVRVLPAASATNVRSLNSTASRLIGLDELPAASMAQLKVDFEVAEAAHGAQPAAQARSQWPTGPGGGYPTQLQAPAAPYLGASASPESAAQPEVAPLPSSSAASTVGEAAELIQAVDLRSAAATQATASTARPPTLSPDSATTTAESTALALVQPDVFSEITEEPGPAETSAVLAAEDNIPELDESLDAAELHGEASATPESTYPGQPAPANAVAPSLENLNFRMIQYARQAAQLVRNRGDFGVIYSPNWPAWLAALELRNSTGRPLVLYTTGPAADFLPPAERGWLLEVERMALRRAHLILVPDEAVRQRLAEYYGSSIGAVRVVAPHNEAAVQAVLSEVALG